MAASNGIHGGPWWRSDICLELRDDGSFTWETISHADWGRAEDKLLGHARVHGRYDVAGDSLFLAGERTERWDYLTGSGETDVPPGGPARYRVRAAPDRLVLEFVSDPADAPVQSRMVFRRD